MDYRTHYDLLVSRAKTRGNINEYYEVHHVTPKCMGGDDSNENLVKLTAREHFIAHLLLVKMHTQHVGLVQAATMMCVVSEDNVERRLTNKRYEWLRKRHADAMKISQGGENNSMFGTMWIHNIQQRISTRILKTDPIPEGWEKGRVIDFDRVREKVPKTRNDPNHGHNIRMQAQKLYAEELYNRYVVGKFKSVSAFYKTLDIKESRQALIQIWDRHIPEYKTRKKER